MRADTVSGSRDDRQWRTVALSFAAGAASMSLFLYARDRRRKRRRANDSSRSLHPDSNDENDQSNLTNGSSSSSFLPRSTSFIDTVKQSVEDAVSRIGELPGRRSHWPWETIHRGAAHKRKDSGSGSDPTMKLTPPNKVRENPELCIGSIFGLDVGGTLAKLVYFEQRPDYDTDNCRYVSMREKHYHMAASAQAVLKARRGHDPEDPNSFSSQRVPPNGLHSNESSSEHEVLRRSSYKSKGLLRPKFCSSSALNQQGTRLDKMEFDTKENAANSRTGKAVHTAESDDDLQSLYLLRPESVPDDLNTFASCSHYNSFLNNPESPRSKKNMPRRHTRSNSSDHSTSSSFTNLASSTSSEENNNTDSGSSRMKKSRSMFDLSISEKSRDHAEALDRFYHFARKLDSYREGVKDHKLSFYSRVLGGEFHFIRFETRRMENAMELIRANDLHLTIREMGATGGGAHKYASDWERILGIQMKKQEELASLVAGMQFVLSTVVGECYTFRPRKPKRAPENDSVPGMSVSTSPSISSTARSSSSSVQEEKKFPSPFSSDESDSESVAEQDPVKMDLWNWSRKVQRDAISYSSTYPYLLVTIGTGVSMLRVDGPRKHERISGSTIGGGTYWGLVRLLTDVEEFEDVMRLAEHGDPTKVDMMVGDIYGNNPEALEKLGLPAGLVASSFGKLVAKEDPAAGLTQEDLARALLLMVTNNIGQVAYLNAQLHNTSRIYFVGNFLRGNKLSQRRLSYAIDYWSKGEMEALFLEHEGYFGALGAFLLSQNISHDDLGPRRSVNHRRSQTMEENPLI